MRPLARTTLAVLALIGTGCSLLPLPSRIDRAATVQFVAAGAEEEYALLRSQGDHVVLVFLSADPPVAEAAAFLKSRDLADVDAAIFTVAPREPVLLPQGVSWWRVRVPAAGGDRVRAPARRDGGNPDVRAVAAIDSLEIAGLSLRLLPAAGSRQYLLVDVRNCDDRLLLGPTALMDAADVGAAAAGSAIDLIGLLPPDKIRDLRGVKGLEGSRVLVRGAAPAGDPAAIPLADDHRVLFESGRDGLVSLGPSQSTDS